MRLIRGKVTDIKGKPLIGAKIETANTNIKTVLDLEGNYEIRVTPNIEYLIFSYVLFNSVQVKIDNQDTINVVLEKHGMPEPSIGFSKMESYIRDSLRYPETAKIAKIEGSIIIEFTITNTPHGGPWRGSLSNFKIIESLGYGCDEEAIRLCVKVQKWALRNRQLFSDTALYTIEFKLKK
ncbi:MAG: carboxypeptidase-like regulatory domain-containing protein [Saprospiraceae bacterium]|nr:carboxypeptidase-like regulatory domain-containing protein [Saprospiraceae bacterium]